MLIDVLKLEGVSAEKIVDDAPLFGGGLGLDSLDALQLAVSVEELFGVAIADEESGKEAFQSIDALVAFIQAHGVGR